MICFKNHMYSYFINLRGSVGWVVDSYGEKGSISCQSQFQVSYVQLLSCIIKPESHENSACIQFCK